MAAAGRKHGGLRRIANYVDPTLRHLGIRMIPNRIGYNGVCDVGSDRKLRVNASRLPRAAAADTRPESISAPSSPSSATPSARRFVCSPLRLRLPICSPAAPGHACSSLRWPRLSSSLPLFSGTYRALSTGYHDIRALRNEERVLRSKFGAAFETYCSRTPRWIFI